jgi:hypothetical protein
MNIKDQSIQYDFVIQGRDFHVQFFAPPYLSLSHSTTCDATHALYYELLKRDILPHEIMPINAYHNEIAKSLVYLVADSIQIAEQMDRALQYDDHGAQSALHNLKDSWARHGKERRYGEQILERFQAFIPHPYYGKTMVVDRLKSYRPRWRQQIMVWMLQANNPNQRHTDEGYLHALERYLDERIGWLDVEWWQEPQHAYTDTAWRNMGYEPCARATMRRAMEDAMLQRVNRVTNNFPPYPSPRYMPVSSGEIIYAHWQVKPISGADDLRRAYWTDVIMQRIPALAYAFNRMHSICDDRARYDALIFDWSSIVAGEYGHTESDWWGNPIPLDHAQHVVRMNFAQAVYKLWHWNFSDYAYYEME